MFDICIGSSDRDAAPRVLVTTTDQTSADAIVAALRSASLYQSEGLVPFARAVERGESPASAVSEIQHDEPPVIE